MSPTEYMYAALKIAREGMEKGELPIGSVLIVDDKIIASAHTAEKTVGGLLVHAELRTLLQADQLKPFPGKRRDAILFTTLEPCLMCLGAAMSFLVGTIYYALESPADGAVQLTQNWQRDHDALPAYQIPEFHGGLLRQKSKALFEEYVKHYGTGMPLEWAKTLV